MRHHKPWTAEEEEYLRERWGKSSIPAMAKKLDRTAKAVTVRAQRLSLGPHLMSGDYISLNQLLIAVKGTNSNGGYVIKSWGQKRGLPIHTRKVNNSKVKVVYLDEFWAWAKQNRSYIDFSKMEPLALGEEPPWVAEQRKKDFYSFAIQRKDPWTPEDDSRLKMLLQQNKYGYAELSKMLSRSAGAIQRRCQDLGIKERPVRASTQTKWTDTDFEILADGIRHGDSYAEIGEALNRSEKAIRGKVYTVYLTEDADKIRAMMGDHPWGYGAPVPRVKQAVHLSRTTTETKATLSNLCGVLAARLKQMKTSDYDQYFQRAMCTQWDDLHGVCGAGCKDCDSCTEFIRIRPQYCARCGATFYERQEIRFCVNCRIAKKKAAQRKWARLNKTNT